MLLAYEWLAVAYFGGLAVAALSARAPWPRRLTVAAGATTVAAAILVIASAGGDVLRAWVPHLYLVLGYWLPALLAGAPAHPTRFERWLRRSDEMLRPSAISMPPLLRHATELAYLVCYPLVPASFAVVWTSGSPAEVERFWLAVLGAGYVCYASLPWLVSRPPRLATEPAHAPQTIGAVNVRVLGLLSHQLNTFPSGHVAVSLASAAGIASISPLAGALVGITAAAIAAGAIAGRYHYAVDVVLGVVVAAAATALALI